MYDNRALDIQRRAAVQVVSPQQARDIDALFWGQSACVLSYIITYQYMCYSWPRGRCEKCTARRVTNRHTQERISIANVLYASLCTSYWACGAKRMEAEVPMLSSTWLSSPELPSAAREHPWSVLRFSIGIYSSTTVILWVQWWSEIYVEFPNFIRARRVLVLAHTTVFEDLSVQISFPFVRLEWSSWGVRLLTAAAGASHAKWWHMMWSDGTGY